jgi:hypothetical protein
MVRGLGATVVTIFLLVACAAPVVPVTPAASAIPVPPASVAPMPAAPTVEASTTVLPTTTAPATSAPRLPAWTAAVPTPAVPTPAVPTPSASPSIPSPTAPPPSPPATVAPGTGSSSWVSEADALAWHPLGTISADTLDGLVSFAKGWVALDRGSGATWHSSDGRSWKRTKLPMDPPGAVDPLGHLGNASRRTDEMSSSSVAMSTRRANPPRRASGTASSVTGAKPRCNSASAPDRPPAGTSRPRCQRPRVAPVAARNRSCDEVVIVDSNPLAPTIYRPAHRLMRAVLSRTSDPLFVRLEQGEELVRSVLAVVSTFRDLAQNAGVRQ